MNSRKAPETLYVYCLDYCIRRMEQWARGHCGEKSSSVIERLGGSIAEDLLLRAFHLANKCNVSKTKIWRNEWRMFYTSKITSAILSWDGDLVAHLGDRCKNLKRVEVIHLKDFEAGLVSKCPKTINTMDFDGELIYRGKLTRFRTLREGVASNWLCDSENVLRSLLISNMMIPDYPRTVSSGMPALAELHLGNVHARAEDLAEIIRTCGNLRLLKHYQLVSGLFKLHGDAWRKKKPLPTYKLQNLDVDFSHVVRCRMSPEWVLAPDALHLAVRLCPEANSIRLRFDCSTPHDVLTPLLNLQRIKEFSAVCVSSGERSLLDFSDMSPIFEKYGPSDLAYLELKVIEEVEIHVIIQNCVRLDTLILSGCGYVTPSACPSYSCTSYGAGSLRKLRLLFYADGDDFTWDHGVPECFWRATLLPSGINRVVLLQGIFLEYPRISRALTSLIYSPPHGRMPFPNLVAASFCRYDEITADDVASMCGLSGASADASTVPISSVEYIRLSECEKIDESEEGRLRKWLERSSLHSVCLHVDR